MKRIVSITSQLISDYREINREEAVRQGKRRPACLLVEDNPTDIELSARALKTLAVDLKVANTGDEAIRLLNESKDPSYPDFDIVFLDLVLKGSAAQGIQVFEHIRKHFPTVHVVIVSGLVDAGILNLVSKYESGKKGAYLGFITKPLQKMDVTEIFQKHHLSAVYEI